MLAAIARNTSLRQPEISCSISITSPVFFSVLIPVSDLRLITSRNYQSISAVISSLLPSASATNELNRVGPSQLRLLSMRSDQSNISVTS